MVEVHEVEEAPAIVDDFLRDRRAVERHRERRARFKERAVAPRSEREPKPLAAGRKQRRRRMAALELARDQPRVAIDIGTGLQHRHLAIAAGQQREFGPRHHHGEPDGPPRQLLDPERKPDFLGERRRIVMMEDQF